MKVSVFPFRVRLFVSVRVPGVANPPGASLAPAFNTTLPPLVPLPPNVALLATVTVFVAPDESPLISSVPPLTVTSPLLVF